MTTFTDTQKAIFKAVRNFGQLRDYQLATENARQQMQALIDDGYMVKIDDAFIARINAATFVPVEQRTDWGDPQGRTLRQEAINLKGCYLPTSKLPGMDAMPVVDYYTFVATKGE